ncbi:hypothetical protein D3C74_187430 [compost metagenome]
MNKVSTLFNKLFLTHSNKSQETNHADLDQPRGGGVGNLLPLFKVRDQFGKKIISEKVPGKVTKLVFLSDTCGLCFEVLQMLANQSGGYNYLVFKGDEDTYPNVSHKDLHYNFPIIRSTKVVDLFGIKRVPTIVTLDSTGIIERVDEVADIENLFCYLEN